MIKVLKQTLVKPSLTIQRAVPKCVKLLVADKAKNMRTTPRQNDICIFFLERDNRICLPDLWKDAVSEFGTRIRNGSLSRLEFHFWQLWQL